MDNLSNEGMLVPVKKAAPNKRPSILTNIRGRLNTGNYNVSKHFKKNEKNLREKVKFFEKKEAAGQLRADMAQRLQEARELLSRVQALNPGGARPLNMPVAAAAPPSPFAVPSPFVAPSPFAAPSPLAAAAAPSPANELSSAMGGLSLSQPVQPKMSLKKRTTAKSRARLAAANAEYVPPEFILPPANRVPAQLPTRGHYSPNGTYHVDGIVEQQPNANNSAAVVDFSRYGYSSVKSPREKGATKSNIRKTKKYRGVIKPENWEYYERAVGEIEVPPLFHPLTGQPITKEEDAIDILQHAIDMLEGLIEKAVHRAYTLKKQNKKRASSVKPKAGV